MSKKIVGKNRPQALPISRKPVPLVSKPHSLLPSKPKPCDPRFDRAFGHYNEDLFKKSYEWVGDMQEKETQSLIKALKQEKDAYRKESIKRILDRRNNQKAAAKSKALAQEARRALRQQEAKAVTQGKQPYFLKKGQQNVLSNKKKETASDSDETEDIKGRERSKKQISRELRRLPFDIRNELRNK